MKLRVRTEGGSNWDPAVAALNRKTNDRDTASLPDLRINAGEIEFIEDATQQRSIIRGIDLALAWPGVDRAAAVSGQFEVRGETVEVSALIAEPLALTRGEQSNVKMRLVSAPARLGFDGKIALSGTLAEGVVNVESRSLRQVLRWFGHMPGSGPTLSAFSLKGDAVVTRRSLALSRTSVEIDGNVAEGAVVVELDTNRARIQAILDAGRLVATSYLSDWALIPNATSGWSKQPIDLSLMTAADLDLRLSAREVVIGQATLGRTAASLSSRNGRLTLTLGESVAYGGLVRGALVIIPAGAEGMDVRATMNVQRAQISPALGEWFNFRRIEGTGSAQVSLEARGATIDQFASSVSGQITLTGIEGTLVGVNAEAILRRLERRPLASAGVEGRTGRTAFDRLAATFKLAKGVATSEDIILDGPIVRIAAEGIVNAAVRDLDLKGVATLKRQGGANELPFELPFIVQGPWNDPFALPDPQSLIRRSGAAAPLRDITRDRDALRAVSDAISRQAGPEALQSVMPRIPGLAPAPTNSGRP
jgi:AsmA protein